ncbi:MAG TPA: hypothetical protein VFW59_10400, partial [Gallionella sp.]|nr:hypothetical protein [Gallionella sp.]
MTKAAWNYLKKHLYVRLTWHTLLIGLLIGLLATLYETFEHFDTERDGRASEIAYLLNVSLRPAARAAVSHDKALADEVAQGLFAQPSIYRVVISDQQGRVLSEVGRSKFEPGKLAQLMFEKEQDYRVSLSVPEDLAGHAAPDAQVGELYV